MTGGEIEKALQAAQARIGQLQEGLARMIEASRDAYVAVDRTGSIIDWSRRAEEMFGWTRQQAVGRPFTITPPGSDGTEPAGIEQFLAVGLARSAAAGEELRAQDREGRLFPIELTVWATDEGEQRTCHALIHEARPAVAADHSQCRVGAIVESSGAAMIGQSVEGRVLTWNGGAKKMYGYDADDIVGRPFSVLVPPQGQDEFEGVLRAARAGAPVPDLETVRVRKDGSRVDVTESVSATCDPSGAVTGLSTIARDITEQLRTGAALRAALEDARESEARSRRFLADAAHQLRTPIAGIRACAETLIAGTSSVERDRLLIDVVSETSRASRLMAALLQMARLDRGEALSPAPCDLAALCADEIERVRRLAPRLRPALDVAGAPDIKPELDANAVAEILGNLLDNARRHASERIHLGLNMLKGHLEVRVSDDGPGLPADAVDRAFERFVSLDGKGGTGLGLPIARGLARAHGGDLVYEDGAFVLRLPRRRGGPMR